MIVLRRTPFKRPVPPPSLARVKVWEGKLPTPRAPAVCGLARVLVVPLPKEKPLRSRPYRMWVASLACAHCERAGPSQCAHSDGAGKGTGIKSSDAFCFPLCADAPGYLGCHSRIGASGEFGQGGRRGLEELYATITQKVARHTGNWPKDWD